MNKHSVRSRSAAFASPEALPGPLSAATAAALLAAVGDIAIVLSAAGKILDIALPHGELSATDLADSIGRAWSDTVTLESRPKIAEMLADANVPGTEPRWRQVNHPIVAAGSGGGDVPIRYMAMALDGGARIIAIGRDMRAVSVMQQRLLQTQQSLERDYIRLRQAESRYRLLFDVASEAVLIVDAETRQIREANPAAHRLLDAAEGALIGNSIHSIVEASCRDDFIAHLGAAEVADDVAPIPLRLLGQHGEARITARLFRQARAPLLLVRVTAAQGAVSAHHKYDAALSDVVERMPDAFVLADRDMTILTANAAFIELAGLASSDRAVGSKLGNWLGRPSIDLDLIVAQLREHGAVRNVATILRSAGGDQEEIEVSGVVAPMGPELAGGECYGFTIRNVARRLRVAPVQPHATPRSVEQLTELVGRMSLKEIVRESTDMIERLCIEAALAYTSDNRASAAEILGVSRQSLYSKLHRHGLGNLVSGDN